MSIGRVPGATGIQPSIVDAKGDLIVATAADSVDRLAVGSNNQTLLADSAQTTGVKWGSSPQSLLTATGDLLYASAANTPARLGIGSTGNVLTVSGGVPTWAAPAGGGKVLQVVQATYGTSTATSSTAFESSGLSASITPSSTSSKVLVLVNNWMIHGASGSAYSGSQCRIVRGATQIYITNTLGYSSSAQELGWILDMKYLDSPSTTSSTTYSLEYKSLASFTTYIQQGNTTATMILMEIGA